MNFNSKPNSGDIFKPIPISKIIGRSYTFKSEQLKPEDKAEYSIIYDPLFTYGMVPEDRIVPKLDPPIMKCVFNSTDVANWKTKYKQIYNSKKLNYSKKLNHSMNEGFAKRDVKWDWMESKVPNWRKLLISLHKEICERFKGLQGLTKDSMISVFLDKNDWKNFKSGNMNDIKLISCDET